MKKMVVLFVILSLGIGAVPAFAQETAGGSSDDYWGNMGETLLRGFKNVVSSPAEIPMTIQEYHEGAGKPVIRHIAGLIDGSFQMVVRAGSGMWDFVAAFLPGHQDGMPVDPETLF